MRFRHSTHPYIKSLNDVKSAIAFSASHEFSSANPDEILVGDFAVTAITEVIFNSGQCAGAVGDSKAGSLMLFNIGRGHLSISARAGPTSN